MSNEDRTICIALTPPGAAEAAVRAAVAERGWQLIAVDDPLAAMSEVTVRERAQAARSGWGLPRVDRVVFAIVEPRVWDACDDLAAALARYLPDVERFALTGDRLSPLAQAAAGDAPRRRLPGGPRPMRRASGPRPARAAAAEPTDTEPDAGTVTRAELEILLGTGEEQP